MAQFDLHADPTGRGWLLDCQADVLSHLNTRLVVPLMRPDVAPKPGGRLNPVFDVDGKDHVMVTQYAAAIEVRVLGPAVASLADKDREIIGALDVLLTGV